MKDWTLGTWESTLLLGVFMFVLLGLVTSPQLSAQAITSTDNGDQYAACPAGSSEYKYEGNGQGSQTLVAPGLYLFVQSQVKAASVEWGYGSGGHQPPVSYDPGQRSIVVSSADSHGISHIHVCKTREPPPECEIGDPCWCEIGGPGYPCEPDPKCDLSKLVFTETNFGFGFTTAIHSQAGSGCSNPDVFKGRPGDQVRFDVCIDGYAVNGQIDPPPLPYVSGEVITVGPVSEIVRGEYTVVVSDPEFDNCAVPYPYRWIGSVAADTGVTPCLPTEPCWCEEFVGIDPRCEPPPTCNAVATINLNMVAGHVDAQECYDGLSSESHQEIYLLDGDVTICWKSYGGPYDHITNAVVQTPPGAAGTYHDVFNPSYVHLTLDRDMTGYLETKATGDGERCGDYDRINWKMLLTPPEICLPWLP